MNYNNNNKIEDMKNIIDEKNEQLLLKMEDVGEVDVGVGNTHKKAIQGGGNKVELIKLIMKDC